MFNSEQEQRTKKLKRSLEGWREILLTTQSILLWEKQWHPSALFMIVTSLFFSLWVSDPSVLTTFATIGLLITISDYLIPLIATNIWHNNLWTGAKEKKFDELCRRIIIFYTQITTWCDSYYLMRTVRPKMYYSISIGVLIFIAWIGNVVNNLLLTYIFTLLIVMLPGIEHHGFVKKYCGRIFNVIKQLTAKANEKTE